ncbi:DNA-processing protein DprA [Aurantiacibacter poecillastricola]|uniref:DNA-processing protein DprA n=1 Tax=Aurantiacibacter poecillastricola TaxID=3064385 RepID=UPI00273DD9B6|nr:DNA-processing protein DprA [Aurantiacibacter sp. 219JJ12-13]MDP5262247.1 DNA-processing protein DprA [Aurantiacibacter sp. 219JJ12-13]
MSDVPKLTQDEAFARIRLLRSANIGPVSYAQLLGRFGNAQEAIEALPDLAARGAKRNYKPAPRDRIEQEVQAARKAGARYLFHDQPDYPANLAAMEGAPPIVTMRGDLSLASRPCVAMVGARNASAAAVKLARDFARELAAEGFVVVSGLAKGIDGACHEGAMPRTIGVIASGIDIAYPPQHAKLQEQIASEALLIAEEPPGTQPRGQQFPKRNRIIAGLSMGTLVVEAAPKSGSLITARLAGEAGREVMAIPGHPADSRSHGCNQLIREGAVLVQTPQDVVELLSGFDGTPRSSVRESGQDFVFDDTEEDLPADDIAAMLSAAPVAVDELVRQTGSTPGAVQMALLELEIAGRLERHAGGRVSLV